MQIKQILGVVLGTALLLPVSRAELAVVVDNSTDADVAMAFSYLDAGSNKWVVDGWYNIDKKSKGQIKLNTNNELYYIYSEFSNGKKISGGAGSAELKIRSTSFTYEQDKGLPDADRSVSFLRARSNNNKALINIR